MNNRKQLYHGDSLDHFLKIKSILDENGISYETENKLDRGIGGMIDTLLVFERPASGMQEDHKQTYNLYVDSADYIRAKEVIGFIG